MARALQRVWLMLMVMVAIPAPGEPLPTTPGALRRAVSTHGAAEVAAELWQQPTVLAKVLRGVGSADRDWLRVANALRRGTEGAQTTELEDALRFGLINDPAAVLEVAVPVFGVGAVCAARNDPGDSPAQRVLEVDLQLAAVRSLETDSMERRRASCVSSLVDSRGNLAGAF